MIGLLASWRWIVLLAVIGAGWGAHIIDKHNAVSDARTEVHAEYELRAAAAAAKAAQKSAEFEALRAAQEKRHANAQVALRKSLGGAIAAGALADVRIPLYAVRELRDAGTDAEPEPASESGSAVLDGAAVPGQ